MDYQQARFAYVKLKSMLSASTAVAVIINIIVKSAPRKASSISGYHLFNFSDREMLVARRDR